MPKMGCQRENDRKSYRFLFDIFLIEGCILKNNVDTRKTSIMDAFRAAVLWELQAVNCS